MERGPDGAWTAFVAGESAGAGYAFRVDGQGPYPDPYSRSQPRGVHQASEVVEPARSARFGVRDLVIYECHIGTFTPEGTFAAAAGKLPYLRDLGVTALEIMPVAEFPGRRNWGYDGVDWFAPSSAYGGPAGLRRLVEAAHQHGLAVLLDVVYNHFGPEGNYLRQFSPDYFTSRYTTPWGDALNYEGCPYMRKLAVDNALYWLREYGIDGLRLDATFAIFDRSPKHILRELSEAVRAEYPETVLIAETHENDVRYLKGLDEGGWGFDAVWADDFHHVVRRLIAGDSEGYYADYSGTVDELARTLNQGFLFEGQRSSHLGRPRGTPARDRPARQFVYCIQNHDQVGNRAFGDRLNHAVSADRYRLASALLVLLPYTPLLFMGQEFAASTPFQYFTHHSADLGKLVTEGRRREFAAFASFSEIPDPQAEETFRRSKLRWEEADGSPVLELYRECLRLRRDDPVLSRRDRLGMKAEALPGDVLRVDFTGGDERRLLVVNFGESASIFIQGADEVLLSTSEARFGGSGEAPRLVGGRLSLPPATAILLR